MTGEKKVVVSLAGLAERVGAEATGLPRRRLALWLGGAVVFYTIVTLAETNLIPCDTSFESGISHALHCSGVEADDANPSHGKRCAKITAGDSGGFLITPDIRVDPTKPYVFSAYLRGKGSVTMKIITISPTDPYDANWEKSEVVKLTDAWQRHSVVLKPGWNTTGKWDQRPGSGERFRGAITCWTGNSAWVDAVQFEGGEGPSAYAPSEPCSISLLVRAPWNVLLQDEPVGIAIGAWNAGAKPQQLDLRGGARDYDGAIVGRIEQSLSLGPQESEQVAWTMPAALKGFFKVDVMLLADGKPVTAAQTTFCVVPPPRGTPNPDSFFGLQGPVNTEEDADALRRIGVRWFRTGVGWSWMQPKPENKFSWTSTEKKIALFKKYGMELMALVEGVPEWARMPAPKEETEPSRYPPKDVKDLENFMFHLVDHFKGEVKHWEIRNEPDISYLKVPLDRSKAAIYADMVRASAAGARRADPDAKICACGVTSGDMKKKYPFATEVFKTASDSIDIMPVHPYMWPRRVGIEKVPTPEAFGIRELYLEAAEFTKAHGKGQTIWNGEQGLTLDADAAPDSGASREYTNFILRAILLARATGVERLFWFMTYDGRLSNNDKGLWIHGKRPLPVVAGYANLAHLLDGKLLRSRALEMGPKIQAYVFQFQDSSVACLWSPSDTVSMDVAAQGKAPDVLDAMGRSVDPPRKPDGRLALKLSGEPLFLKGESAAFDSLCNAIADSGLSLKPMDLDVRLRSASKATVTLRNNLNRAYSGKVTLSARPPLPSGNAEAAYRLEPLGVSEVEIALAVPDPEKLNGITLIATAESPNGSVAAEQQVSLLICRKCPQPPAVDGNLEEWQKLSPIVLNTVEQVLPSDARGGWRGADDLSARAYTGWDASGLYLAVAVKDDVDCNKKTEQRIWDGDSIQAAFDVGNNAISGAGYDSDDRQFNMAATAAGPRVEQSQAGAAADVRIAVRKEKGSVCYEVAIPWSRLGGVAPAPGQIMGFNFIVNDDDGRGRERWIGLTGGIGEDKAPALFKRLVFVGN